jgi:hypothetical protein
MSGYGHFTGQHAPTSVRGLQADPTVGALKIPLWDRNSIGAQLLRGKAERLELFTVERLVVARETH